MRLSPWCRDQATGKEDGKSDRGWHWLPVQNTKYKEIVPGKKKQKKWQSCSNQCDKSSGEDRRGWREKDYGASSCGRISAHKQQTSVYPENHMQDEAWCKDETQDRHTRGQQQTLARGGTLSSLKIRLLNIVPTAKNRNPLSPVLF